MGSCWVLFDQTLDIDLALQTQKLGFSCGNDDSFCR